MHLKQFLVISTLLLSFGSELFSQVEYFAFNDGSVSEGILLDRDGDPISNGDETAPGNTQGSLMQIGYFDGQTVGNFSTAFEGVFVPMLSFFSGDSSTGTDAIADGLFSLQFVFSVNPPTEGTKFAGSPMAETVPVSGNPPAGGYLVLRFYDTPDTSGYYNSIAQSTFTWAPAVAPFPAGTFLDLVSPFSGGDQNLALESGADPTLGIQATLIPEPGLSGILVAGLGLVAFMRRRKA